MKRGGIMKHKWIVNEPIAVLQIVHGLTEHSRRDMKNWQDF